MKKVPKYDALLLEEGIDKSKYLSNISIDCVILGFNGNNLEVLLLQIKESNKWIIPGGYIEKEESVDTAAYRVLKSRIGVDNIFLDQFHCFGNNDRMKGFMENYPANFWMRQRFVTIGYYALVKQSEVLPKIDLLSSSSKWFDIHKLPDLVMDHELIIKKALENLKNVLAYKPIGHNLLPEEFTMPQLQCLYESILGYSLNRGNFYRRMMKENLLIKTDKKLFTGSAHKAPILYKFDLVRYNNMLNDYSFSFI